MFKNRALLTILASIIITLLIWIFSKAYYDDWFINNYKYVAKGASLAATIIFSWSMILSARNNLVEKFFGGLDKVYIAHRYLGMSGFFLILLHPLFLGMDRLPNIVNFLGYFNFLDWSSNYASGLSLGIITLALLLVLIYLSVNLRIPYSIWKMSHSWMILFYLLAIIHIVLVDADIAKYPLLAIWMYSWLTISLAAGLYMVLGYKFLSKKYSYKITSLEKFHNSLEMVIEPNNPNQVLKHKPSQFVFIAFDDLNGGQELHPFSIASAPNLEYSLKFGIKKLGDFTKKLSDLQEGMNVTIYGPYGEFSDKFLRAKKDCVFIGAGVGITPFLGMWDMSLHSDEKVVLDESYHLKAYDPESVKVWKSPKVGLFYISRNLEDATFDNDIKHIAVKSKFNQFSHYEDKGHYYELYLTSKEHKRINADYIFSKIGSLEDKLFFICGPTQLKNSLAKQLKSYGVKNKQIIVEEFDFRKIEWPRFNLFKYIKKLLRPKFN